MSDPTPGPAQGPYATAANAYRHNGWSPLPLPHGHKKPPPDGWTGRDGAWPSGADVHAWSETHGAGNIGLRLPPNVLGIDVDHYGTKPGAAVLDALEKQHGPLPPTWTSSSRGGRSGIRFYRIPTGLRWPGQLGSGIETIRYDHRYAVAWPSLHPEGGTYRWARPDGTIALEEIPNVDDLPHLPQAWVQALTNGALSTDQPRADLRRTEIDSWLYGHGGAAPCRVMTNILDRGLADLTTGGSRHDTALALTNRIAWLAGEGHTGGSEALATAAVAFAKVTGDRHEDGEWERMVDGAVRLSAAAHPAKLPDPCLEPFAALINKGATPWEKTPTPPTAASSTTTSTSPAASSASPTPKNESPTPSSASPTPSTASEPSSSTDPDDRTSWWPRHPAQALDDDNAEPGPAHLTRDDGQALFYPGRINGLLGPSESGKTWIALHAAVQAVQAGDNVTILDFEDTHRGTLGRLKALWLTDDQIRDHVAYIGPDEPITSPLFPAGRDLHEHLTHWQPACIVLDGVNAAMTLHGLDLISNKDATIFAQHVLRPLTTTGACVIYVDHTPKDKDNNSAGGIGAQAKRAMTTGCAIRVHVNKQFGKGQNGTLTLNVDKDRQGDVRGASKPSGEGGHWAGTAQLTSHDDGTVTIVVQSPDTRDAIRKEAPTFRPTVYMERVSEYVTANPGMGQKFIKGAVRGDHHRNLDALLRLIDEGWIRVEQDGQTHRHYTVRAFSELETPPNQTTGGDRGWTEGGPGVAPPVKEPGVGGGDRPGRSPGPHPPGSPPPSPNGVNGKTTPGSPQLVRRVIGDREVLIDLDTGEIHNR
jgi:hypothetical protein